jgi:Flp pilus assembly protein TadG
MAIMMLGIMAVVTFIVGGIVDYMSLQNQQQTLQGVADRAAIAAAQELVVFKGSNDRIAAVAKTFVDANYHERAHTTTAQVTEKGKAVEVNITATPQTYFPGPIAQGVKVVKATATAEIAGGGYVCMIGLDPTAPSTLDMSDKARVTAQKCAIYSNSKNKASLNLHSLARVKADLVCVAGGVSGSTSAVTPNAPVTDCPALRDPLRDRPQPNVGLLQCDHVLTVVITALSGKVKLKPGVYCGGINVVGGDVKLDPGTYIMNNGTLTVTAGGKLVGENVGFFLTGALSTIQFGPSSTISLTAPKTGDMAGMLFFEDRHTIFAIPHRIASDNARNLVGTIYLPNNQLTIDSKHPIADQSDYTVIIAKKFQMMDGPELVLNTDYDHSPIPVPDGVGNKARPMVHLTRNQS